VFCSPCLYEADEPPCNGHNICMQRIEPHAVVESVQRLVGLRSWNRNLQTRGRLNYLPILNDAPNGKPLGVVERASIGQTWEADQRDFHDGNDSGSSEHIEVPAVK
jgi:hypothetical protein